MKRFGTVTAIAVALALVVATAASAEVVAGTGAITARGAGVARVTCNGRVIIRAHGAGTVWVRNAEKVRASGRGVRADLPGGSVLFRNWSGRIQVGGEELTVAIVGRLIDFTAKGTGTVFLRGRGSYWLRGERGEWSRDGLAVTLEAAM
jgi:hypothetical protein